MFSLLFAFLCLFISVFLFLRFDVDSSNFEAKLICILIVALMEVVLIIVRRDKTEYLRRRFVTTFNLFLLAFLCVHFQKFVDLLVFGNAIQRYELYANHQVVLRAASVCLLGLSALVLGYIVSAEYGKPLKEHNCIIYGKRTFSVLNILYIISLALFLAYNARTYLQGNYSQELLELSKGTMSTYSVILLNCCMYSITILRGYSLAINGKRPSLKNYLSSLGVIYYLCGGIYMLFCFALGDRGPMIFFFLTLLFGYILATKHRFNIMSVILVLFLGAFLINAIGIRRSNDQRYSIEEYNQQIMDINSVSPLTSELSSSNRTVIYAVESTPSIYPYRYGLFMLNSLLSIVPFSGSIFRAMGFSFNSLSHYAHSSQFFTWYEQGDNPYSGVGSSTIADVYVDFGPWGVIVILFFLGMLIRRLDLMLFNRDVRCYSLFMLVLGCVFFSQSIYIPRSMLVPILRTTVWSFVYLWLIILITKHRA